MSNHTNSLTTHHEETTSSLIKTLETMRATDTRPPTQTEDCKDEDECGSSMNYNNDVENDANTVRLFPVDQGPTTTTKPVRFCEVSDVYKDYIEKNRDIIERKCKRFYKCASELYKAETPSRILESGDIQLHKICGLKEGPTHNLCNSTEIESKTEKLFNTRLRTLHCYCEVVSPAKSFPLVPLIGGVCGGALVLLLIFIIFLLCVRRRKLRA